MNERRETNYQAWLEEARHDELNVENNLAAETVPWDTVCFHAQQAVEKTLKAFLVYHRQPVPRTHDLVVLLASCAQIDAELAGLEEDCRALTYYAVSACYPADLYEPTEEDGRQMVSVARRVLPVLREK